ncbi:endo-1,4-beta-xylanase [Nocardiopsis sp. CT-R113]|uniref:Beta-xylanase n=1 Tax=Nocardiopsis codii TaxID=3065942 RepID=A0ABU7KEN4_9ACTN|nr:endo-1,4-beta-xylanase [Nocardiopsis sp. CT-R113]MEE2040693.1 endo-1,4-beta-xylanase [Nocardiopsis sp. CT-R113]
MSGNTGHARRRAAAAAATVLTAALLAGGFAAAAHGQEDAAVGAVQEGSLRDLADQRGVFMGTALASHRLNEAAYAQTAAAEFNSVTHENDLKWEAVQPQQGQYSWSGADRVVDFAEDNGQDVHGHTLVWHSQLPSWVSGGGFTADQLLDVMDDHISTTMGRYAGRIDTWDVVNEPIGDDARFRDSVFHRTLGEDFVAESLRMARAADPAAELYINDYSIDGVNAKSDAYYDLVVDLLDQGVPLDGIGFQSHLIVGQVPASMRQNIERFTDLGLKVRITELDIRMNVPASQADLERQADDYREVVTTCLEVDGCAGVTVWGVTDAYSWVPDHFDGQGAALPIDGSYQPKPAYWAVHEALGGDPGPQPTDPPTEQPTEPDGDCEAGYRVTNQWQNGFQAEVTVTAGRAVDGWTVTWDFGGDERVGHAWNASVSTSGSTVTAVNAAHNGVLAAGGSTSFGFTGTHDGTVSAPRPVCSAT